MVKALKGRMTLNLDITRYYKVLLGMTFLQIFNDSNMDLRW